ncbi:beta-carotene ketolase (CrtW type) [Catalinimonas alkaloidigena]|uniref:Beta-carotene ketolase (CrtW type) n=1 Tax=Catalinimonas alkaloidigena TaxID=1075417 RepID=A0A1G9M4J5_9BACT|nr:fatty acid desaturase [Catalinimonas alkaloidigena]SDL69118.1 beta-carotene ketolase (CrtW type) [Catalinimonas alkaloidigena]
MSNPRVLATQPPYRGLWIAAAVLVLWATSLLWLLHYPLDFRDPLVYLFVLVQTHLYTGLFITAHDAMHGVVSPRHPRLNRAVGWLCAGLFAFNSYPRLFRKHHEHHRYAVSDRDPDYHEGGFWAWYLSFLRQYITGWQILLMALTFNLLKLVVPTENLIVFWMVPAVLSTFQLFYFGTYVPHRGEHAADDPHKARSQSLNHVWAFLSCYFFGYHHEHHAHPYLPWWRLPQAREQALTSHR